MITLTNLSYAYNKHSVALTDINAQIGPGIHLLMGENGAGKTTLLHLIAGLRLASPETSCEIDGIPTSLRLPAILSRTFILADNASFPYPTIADMVLYHAPFYPNFSADTLQECLEAFGLNATEKFDLYSLGNRKKAQLAYALALHTDYLLLDEPANGLDITSRHTLLELLARHTSPEQTVIISTHVVFDFQNLFDGVIALRGSQLALAMPTWEITKKVSFVSEQLPPEGAIFMHSTLGRFDAIVPNTAGDVTDINYTLLFTALQSPEAHKLINALK